MLKRGKSSTFQNCIQVFFKVTQLLEKAVKQHCSCCDFSLWLLVKEVCTFDLSCPENIFWVTGWITRLLGKRIEVAVEHVWFDHTWEKLLVTCQVDVILVVEHAVYEVGW